MIKRLFLILSLISGVPACADLTHAEYLRSTVANHKPAFALAALAGLYAGYRWFRIPEKPAIDLKNFNLVTFIPEEPQADSKRFEDVLTCIRNKDQEFDLHIKIPRKKVAPTKIPTEKTENNASVEFDPRHYRVRSGAPAGIKDTIFLHSHGWLGGPCCKGIEHRCRGVGAHLVNRYIERSLVNGVYVGFDYLTDRRRAFNFGQEHDVACLYAVYEAVVQANPGAEIVLVGDCKGAATILNLITLPAYKDKLGKLKAVMLESPPVSLHGVAQTIASKYLFWLPGSTWLTYGVFKTFFPSHDANNEYSILGAPQQNIPQDLPILIGRIIGDDIASDQDIEQMIKKLRSNGNKHVYLFTLENSGGNNREIPKNRLPSTTKIWHGRLTNVPAFQQAANAFLKKYDITYDQKCADGGELYLECAQAEAELCSN